MIQNSLSCCVLKEVVMVCVRKEIASIKGMKFDSSALLI
jgi:hypothetical protein